MAVDLKKIDGQQVLRSVFDPDSNRLRTDATVSTSVGTVEVEIDQASDSIKLGDGTNLFTSTTVGADTGLDINVINSSLTVDSTDLDVRDLSHTQDTVHLGDGTNLTSVNASNELQTRDDDANTSLSSIDSKLVDGNDIGDITVNNASGASAVNIQDGGNSITVDATDLDIRDINQTQDNIAIGDGSSLYTNTFIGSDNILNIKEFEGQTFYKIIDEPDASTTYIGKTYDLDADTSSAVWQISRTVETGNLTITQYADDEATYDKIWDNRTSLFGAVPFTNSLSLQFDGANDFLDISHDTSIDFDFRSDAASFNCWVKTSDTSNGKTYMEKMDSNTGWRFYLNSNNLTLELRATGTGDRIRVRTDNSDSVGDTLNDGSWHMITATYDGSGNASGVTLYVDGSTSGFSLDIQNDTLAGDSSNTVNAAVGGRTGGGNNFGPGNIDEVSIWDVELTSGQVSTIYNSGSPVNIQGQSGAISSSLVYWARMGDGPSDVFPTIEDVENNISGTMTNMTAGDIEGAVP